MEQLALVINQPEDGKFLNKIGWNKQEFMDVVTSITEKYYGVQYSEEQMAIAKKDRATLNAMRTAISNRRIELKKAILAPYDAFEKEVKEVVALIDKPIAMIDEQTLVYEEKLKEDKRQELIKHFNDNIGEFEGTLTFDMIFNPKWLNKTTSIKSCKEEIAAQINQTDTDIRAIDTLIEEKYRAYAKDFYFRKHRNITSVFNEIGRMREVDRKAEEKRIAKEEAERLRQEQETSKKANSINPITEPENTQETSWNIPAEPVPESNGNITKPAESVIKPAENVKLVDEFADKDTDTKIYKASFTIRGTKAEIMAVKEFMLNHNIQFGKVEK